MVPNASSYWHWPHCAAKLGATFFGLKNLLSILPSCLTTVHQLQAQRSSLDLRTAAAKVVERDVYYALWAVDLSWIMASVLCSELAQSTSTDKDWANVCNLFAQSKLPCASQKHNRTKARWIFHHCISWTLYVSWNKSNSVIKY